MIFTIKTSLKHENCYLIYIFSIDILLTTINLIKIAYKKVEMKYSIILMQANHT